MKKFVIFLPILALTSACATAGTNLTDCLGKGCSVGVDFLYARGPASVDGYGAPGSDMDSPQAPVSLTHADIHGVCQVQAQGELGAYKTCNQVEILLLDQRKNIVQKTHTDLAGNFEFTMVKSGRYSFVARDSRFETVPGDRATASVDGGQIVVSVRERRFANDTRP